MNGTNYLILGNGVSGKAAYKLCEKKGYTATIISDDTIPSLSECQAYDEIIVSPGLPPTNFLYLQAIQSGRPIISELEFATRYTTNPIIAITGTNGKTTTVELTTALLNAAGENAIACGNIGLPVSEAILNIDKDTILVIEVSSFQLERCIEFAPDVAVILNITSDHIDRYENFQEYADTKLKILDNTNPFNALVHKDLLPFLSFEKHNGINVFFISPNSLSGEDPYIFIDRGPYVAIEDLKLKGTHNYENIMAALTAVSLLKGDDFIQQDTIRNALCNFSTSEHRLEQILEKDGIIYINDSKSTNPDAVIKAVECVGDNKNVILILGGLDKEMDFTPLASLEKYIKECHIMGECRHKLEDTLKNSLPTVLHDSFDAAVQAAISTATTGDIVLLSPGCASMDMFKNYKERGNKFKEMICNL